MLSFDLEQHCIVTTIQLFPESMSTYYALGIVPHSDTTGGNRTKTMLRELTEQWERQATNTWKNQILPFMQVRTKFYIFSWGSFLCFQGPGCTAMKSGLWMLLMQGGVEHAGGTQPARGRGLHLQCRALGMGSHWKDFTKEEHNQICLYKDPVWAKYLGK